MVQHKWVDLPNLQANSNVQRVDTYWTLCIKETSKIGPSALQSVWTMVFCLNWASCSTTSTWCAFATMLAPITNCACFMDGTWPSRPAACRSLEPYSCHIKHALCLPVRWLWTLIPPPSLPRKNNRTPAESTFWVIFKEICPVFLTIATQPSPSKNPAIYSSSSCVGFWGAESTAFNGSW